MFSAFLSPLSFVLNVSELETENEAVYFTSVWNIFPVVLTARSTREQRDSAVIKRSRSWNEIVIFSVIVPNYTVFSENLLGNCELVVLKWWTCRINSCPHTHTRCDGVTSVRTTRGQKPDPVRDGCTGLCTGTPVWKCHHDLTDRQADREWDRDTGTTPHHQLSANGGWKY